MTGSSKQQTAPRRQTIKVVLFVLVATLIVLTWFFVPTHMLTLDYLQAHLQELQAAVQLNPIKSLLIYSGVSIVLLTASLPAAALMTLLGGALFGFLPGVLLVLFTSTVGATLSFLMARYFFQDYFNKKFYQQFEKINNEFKNQGVFYLLTLRLVPLFPFFLVNLAMGLTPIRTFDYIVMSFIGMIPGSMVYVYAGLSFSKIHSVRDILSTSVVVSLILLGAAPYMGKWAIEFFRKRKLYSGFKQPAKFDYNMLVIGGGSAGLVTAYISSTLKAKVGLIEKKEMGGDCLHTGCVPSKSLIKAAKIVSLSQSVSKYGIKDYKAEFDFSDVMKRVRKVIEEITPHDSAQRYTALGVDCISGEAQILGPWQVKVEDKILTTKSLVIATGARPVIPAIAGIENVSYLTSETVWSLKELPKKFLIVGGGSIGVELAQAFARLGSEVTILEGADRLLLREDAMTSHLIAQSLEEEGVKIFLKTKLKSLLAGQAFCESAEGPLELAFDQILFAVGRKPSTSGFGLEKLNLRYNADHTINVDSFMRTSLPNVYACGDVAGPYQLTHAAAHQAWYVAVNSLLGFFKKFEVDYKVIPRTTYTDPEVASVGMLENELRENKIEYDETIYHLSDLDRAIIEGETKGFVRIFTRKGSDQILGATIVSSQAGLMILEIVTAMKYKLGLGKILGTIHAYPGMGEANKYAAGMWRKNHSPEWVFRWLSKWHKMRRG